MCGEREHRADAGQRDQVAQREAVGAAREDAHDESERADAQRHSASASGSGQGERRQHARAQEPEHDPAHGLVARHRAHERQRIHQPAHETGGPRERERDQPGEEAHRGAVTAAATPADDRERGRGRAEVERRDLRARDAEAADERAAVAEQERADPVGVDVARRRRVAEHLEPRQQRHGREAEREGDREAALEPSRACPRARPSQITQVAERERRQLLRAAREVQGRARARARRWRCAP